MTSIFHRVKKWIECDEQHWLSHKTAPLISKRTLFLNVMASRHDKYSKAKLKKKDWLLELDSKPYNIERRYNRIVSLTVKA